MLRMAGNRLAVSVPTLLIVILFVFLLVDLMPGDPAQVLAGESASPEVVEQIRSQLGLDRPLLVRFGSYLGDVSRGDLGESLFTSRRVTSSVATGLAITGSLAVVALVMSVLLSLVLGTLAGLNPGSWGDRVVTAGSALGLAVPSFVVALLLVIPLALQRSWFPATGYAPLSDGFWPWLHHLLLPAFALAVNSMAELTRQIRGAIVDTVEKDFVRTSMALGILPRRVYGKHVAKNAAPPVVTVGGLQVARILGSAVIIEQVFAMPGFGSIVFTAVNRQDIPLIQGFVLVSAAIVLLTNLLVDMSYAYFTPRLRGA